MPPRRPIFTQEPRRHEKDAKGPAARPAQAQKTSEPLHPDIIRRLMEINYSCGLGIEHDLKPDEWADRGKVQAAFEEQLSHVSLTLHPDQQSAVLARVRRLLLTAEGVEELAERLLKNE